MTELPSADRVQFIWDVVFVGDVVGVVVGVVLVTTVVVGAETTVVFIDDDREPCGEVAARRDASACACRTAASYVAFAARYFW